MQHSLRPFPYGAREGDIVLRLYVGPDENPEECAALLRQVYARASFTEVWVDVASLAGPHGRALGLALRAQGWNTLAVGTSEGLLWPTTPGRIVLDVSAFLATPVEDWPRWRNDLSKATGRIPQVDEIFALGPCAECLKTDALTTLEMLLAPGDGCTLYLSSEETQGAAIDACARSGRPWAIRRAGPYQLSERAPVASPAG